MASYNHSFVLFAATLFLAWSSADAVAVEEEKAFQLQRMLSMEIVESEEATTTNIVTQDKHHYDVPPCDFPDERLIRIMGIDGEYCAPKCDASTQACTDDVPDGVTGVSSKFDGFKRLFCLFVWRMTCVS